jgi:uncharacterized repeat protein (TIGR03917 family)
VTFLQRIDGSSITVSTQPGGPDGDRVVLLRLQSPLLDLVNAVYLQSAEANRLADGLSRAAARTRRRAAPHGAGGRVGAATDVPRRAPISRRVVVAREGTSVADLRALLGQLPPDATLLDFGSDTDLSLVFALAGL